MLTRQFYEDAIVQLRHVMDQRRNQNIVYYGIATSDFELCLVASYVGRWKEMTRDSPPERIHCVERHVNYHSST